MLIRGLAHPVVAGGGASRMAGVDGGGGGAGAEKNEEEGDRDRDRDRDRDGDVGGFPSFPEPPDLQVRSIHWFPYDPVGEVNADP